MVIQDMRRLHQLQTQAPDLPSIKTKHIHPQGTMKPIILTPTHGMSIIGTTLGALVLVIYLITTGYAILKAEGTTASYVVGISAFLGFFLIHLFSLLPFIGQVVLLALTGTLHVVNHTYEYYEITFEQYVLIYLMFALMFAWGLYRTYKTKRNIWDRRIGTDTIFGFYSDGIISMLNQNKDDMDLIYKHQAEENTHDIFTEMSNKGRFYVFNDLPAPYSPSNYVDNVLLAGNNLIITRSLLLGNGVHSVSTTATNEAESDELNVTDRNYAIHMQEHYKKLFPHLKISLWFIIHPSEKPTKESRMIIDDSSLPKRIHIITAKEIRLLERSLYKSFYPVLFTRRSDIIRLNSMRQRAHFTNMQKSEDARFLKRF